ncbi:hypothetical protein D3C86_1659470 [compost metagenome]
MAKPPLYVNKRGYSSGNNLYIHAALAADNEDPKRFKQREVIDVYQLDNGKYSHTIYLPKNKRLTGFVVHDDVLIALHERYLTTYSISRFESGEAENPSP